METFSETGANLADASKKIAQRVFVIFENRLQLLAVEAQEERVRLVKAVWMGMGIIAFSLLAGVTLTVLVAVLFWNNYPAVALLALAALYVAVAACFYFKLAQLQRDWQTFAGTMDQLRKDRECLQKQLD